MTALLDRTHRFQLGDLIRHRDDSGQTAAEIVALTLRLRDVDGQTVAFPTYTLWDDEVAGEVEDVLCTDDLVEAS
jgi:small-conductance mechanosensitive channel